MALSIADLPGQITEPQSPSTGRIYTVEEWLKMPVKRPYTELVEGKLKRMPAGTPNHSRIIYNVRRALDGLVAGHSLGQIDSEVNVIIQGLTKNNGWIPDLAFASKTSRLKIGANWEGVPDWTLAKSRCSARS